MFIDEAEITVKAGKGGDGAVSFRHERFIAKGGPDGGDGGRGGDVIIIGKHDMNTLSSFRAKKIYTAGDGENGKHKKMHGQDGDDCLIIVPLGTIISPINTQTAPVDITADGQRIIIAKGGNGGWGNAHFATSIKQAPTWSKKGLPGESCQIKLELRLIADVGLVGLPNVGKSTLLSVISHAHPKIADYPFTTLEPQLGVASVGEDHFVVADIPGLVEGAATGKGLGDKFLRHIYRTKTIVYLLDATSTTLKKDYQVLQKELAEYDQELLTKKSLIFVNKSDVLNSETRKSIKKTFPTAIFISAATHENIDLALKALLKLLQD